MAPWLLVRCHWNLVVVASSPCGWCHCILVLVLALRCRAGGTMLVFDKLDYTLTGKSILDMTDHFGDKHLLGAGGLGLCTSEPPLPPAPALPPLHPPASACPCPLASAYPCPAHAPPVPLLCASPQPALGLDPSPGHAVGNAGASVHRQPGYTVSTVQGCASGRAARWP